MGVRPLKGLPNRASPESRMLRQNPEWGASPDLRRQAELAGEAVQVGGDGGLGLGLVRDPEQGLGDSGCFPPGELAGVRLASEDDDLRASLAARVVPPVCEAGG